MGKVVLLQADIERLPDSESNKSFNDKAKKVNDVSIKMNEALRHIKEAGDVINNLDYESLLLMPVGCSSTTRIYNELVVMFEAFDESAKLDTKRILEGIVQ